MKIKMVLTPLLDEREFKGFLDLNILSKNNISYGSVPSFITLILQIDGLPMPTPIDSVRYPTHALTHFNYGFVFEADTDLLRIISNVAPNCLKTFGKGKLLMTGNLLDWYHAVIDGSSLRNTLECRACYNYVYYQFVSKDLGCLWNKFQRKSHKDKTFTLTPK